MKHLLAALTLAALPLTAATITVQYSGTITTSTLSSIPVGSAFSGTFTYDTSTVGTSPGIGVQYAAAGESAAMGAESVSSTAGNIFVIDDFPFGTDYLDQLAWGSAGSVLASTALHNELVSFNLFNRYFSVGLRTISPASGGGPLLSTGLPDPLPSFDSAIFRVGGSRTVDAMTREATGEITTLTVVPEPPTFSLAGLALLALGWRRRGN